MSSASPQVDADVRRGVHATNRRFEQHFNLGDPAGAAREVYSEGARILPPGAPLVEGREAIGRFWSDAQAGGLERVALSTVDLQPSGDQLYEIGRAALTLTGGGQATAKYVVIWQHDGERWRWHVDIWNMNPA